MPIGLIQDISQDLPRGTTLLGIDVGTKTLGLALAGPDLTMATPLKTLRRTKFVQDVEQLAMIVRDYDIGAFVIGLPLNMDGSAGRKAQSVRDFAKELTRYPQVVGINPWIGFMDERLSTMAVESLVDENWDISKRKAKSKGLIDSLAAQLILQNALDILTEY